MNGLYLLARSTNKNISSTCNHIKKESILPHEKPIKYLYYLCLIKVIHLVKKKKDIYIYIYIYIYICVCVCMQVG